MKQKIKFSDLSWPLKVGAISAWVIGLFYCMIFGLGIVLGILSAL